MLKRKKSGYVLINISGLNLNRVLNEIVLHFGTITNINKVDNSNIQFCIPANKVQYLIAKYNNSCYTISVVRSYHTFDIMDWLFCRFGLVLGVMLMTIILFVLNLFCLGYHINCDDTSTKASIQEYLHSQKVIGSLISNMDYADLEANLLNQFDTISLVDISRRGVYLIINVTMAVPPNPPLDKSNAEIVALHDGIITRMHLVSGTALVSVGDVVHKGQVLITNSYTDMFDNVVTCEARGTVFAKHWYSATVDYPIHTIEYARSGEYLIEKSIIGVGVNIPITTLDDIPPHCEVEHTYTYLTHNLGIPLQLQTTYYYLLDQVSVDHDFEADKEAVIYEARELVRAECNENDVVDQKYTIALVGDVYFVTYYMCVEIQITEE